MAKAELKEIPQTAIIPCPRCLNGQILAINANVCFQCGYELKEVCGEVTEGAQLLQNHIPCKAVERIACPKCGKEVCGEAISQ